MSDLLTRTAELVAVASPSHHEGALADLVESRLRSAPWLVVDRIGDNVVARTRLQRPTRLLLAGHLDTVPANGNEHPRLDGDTLWGLGAADMKAGLAVMLDLATTLPDPALDATYVFYVCEEVARVHNGLQHLLEQRPDLLQGDAAVLGEPTGAVVEAGCQGSLRVEITLGGRRAHTARPWMGVNAIHRLAPLLVAVERFEPRMPVLDGCQYREALSAVAVEGGVAANVVPDRATVVVNHRFAPDRSPTEAEAMLRHLLAPVLGQDDGFRVLDVAPAAPPGLDHPVLASLLAGTGQPPRAKLGWTDVAFFAERGVPAVNFGPGDPTLAHTAGERVGRAEVESVRSALRTLLAGG